MTTEEIQYLKDEALLKGYAIMMESYQEQIEQLEIWKDETLEKMQEIRRKRMTQNSLR